MTSNNNTHLQTIAHYDEVIASDLGSFVYDHLDQNPLVNDAYRGKSV
jgi:hypothetical protein